MNIRPWLIVGLSLCSGIWILSCDSDPSPPRVDHIEADFKFVRFDQAVMNLDSNQFETDFSDLVRQYPSFTQLYFERIVGLSLDSTHQIRAFLESEASQALHDSIQLRFDDMSDIQKEFAQAFRYYRYYFPDESAPHVYTSCTEFSVGAFLFVDTLAKNRLKDAIGISLEFFLGESFPYERLGLGGQSTFSAYLTRTFNKAHLVRKALQVLVEDRFLPLKDNRLIDYMVQNGAQLVMLEHLLPQIPDSVLFEFTPEQVAWCQDNELQIWAHIIDRDLLYSRRMSDIATLIRPAPSSAGMPPESPGQTANYIGYKIVKAYMDQTGADVKDLSHLRDAQEVLTRSKYKAR